MVAWASLAGQAVLLVRQGMRLDDEVSLVLSVVLGALLVGYVSAGVVRARTFGCGPCPTFAHPRGALVPRDPLFARAR